MRFFKIIKGKRKLSTSASRGIKELIEIDKKHVIHPYSSLINPSDHLIIKSADKCNYFLSDGTKLIDGMSSWWAAIHGYNVEVLNNTIYSQLGNMSHVMFGGISHQPAIELSQKLIEITPKNLTKVFLCDSGSVVSTLSNCIF